MKSSFAKIIIFALLYVVFIFSAFADNFNFKVSEIIISENGNKYKGIDGGTVTTNDGLTITSNNFEYNKLTNILEAYGDVKITDTKKDIVMFTEKVFYFKREEKISTKGKTDSVIKKIYKVNSSDLILYRDSMILSSIKPTVIKDDSSNVYNLKNFEFLINDELLKSDKIEIVTNDNKIKSDKYFFGTGFFNLKTKKFIAKDVKITFNKTMYDNNENDPRLVGVNGYGNEFNTHLQKGVFTTCKKNDKCPPWVIKAEKIKHDKINKKIIYKNAWLKVYDIPVVYFPKFFHPDPTVKRQSGFLKPNISGSELMGRSIYAPYFFAISDDKDLTFKPRYYDNKKYILQNEYRQETKNSSFLADFSIAKGHDSSTLDKNDSRSHLFINSFTKLNLENFDKSTLEVTYEKASNDTYLKLFQLESPLLLNHNLGSLESKIKLDLSNESFDFDTSFQRYETLAGLNHDRYQYILPNYNFYKSLKLKNLNGILSINSTGTNNLSNTNILSTSNTNNFNYTSYDIISDLGIKNDFGVYFKNLNSIAKNHATYKSSPQSELMSMYAFNTSLPLIKRGKENIKTITPKVSFMFSPHKMKNHEVSKRRINFDNIYSPNRLSLGDSYEEGGSLTLGIEFKNEDVSKLNKEYDSPEKIKEDDEEDLDKYLEFKLATVIRAKEQKNLPKNSTVGRKTSNIVGQINYTLSEYLRFNYDFSIDNNLSTFEYNSIDATFMFNNFSSQFEFTEEDGLLGSTNVIKNTTKYNLDKYNSFSFETRKNRKINLTEYYDLTYQYENDCLTAGVQYRKKYYKDRDILPSEELFFTITIIPLTKYSPANILNLFE